MYESFVNKKLFILLGIIIFFCAVPFVLHFVFKIQILPSESTSFNVHRDIGKLFILLGYIVFVWWYAFFIFINSIAIRAPKGVDIKNETEVISELKNTFAEVRDGQAGVFEVVDINNGIEVRWNQNIDFNQLLSLGSSSVKYIVTFDLNKTGQAKIYSSIIHTDKLVGITGASVGVSWAGGIQYETGGSVIPSFVKGDDGKTHIVLKKMSYGNSAIIDPAIEIFKNAGWDSVFVTLKSHLSRVIYRIIGILVFIFGVICIFLGAVFLML